MEISSLWYLIIRLEWLATVNKIRKITAMSKCKQIYPIQLATLVELCTHTQNTNLSYEISNDCYVY